jgi:uncharacterized protein
MRDYRDAKVMAASLRTALADQGHAVSHSQSLELIAKAFGLESWNVLAASVGSGRRARAAPTSWAPGERVTIRHVHDGEVTYANAALVVEDRPTRLVLYMPFGSDMRVTHFDWATGRRDGPHPQRRHTTDALAIFTPGDAHSVTAMYHGGGGPFICWYVDMLEPFHRVPGGIVTSDQQLDIVAGPDLRWRWKDEDQVARSVELGRYTEAQARAIRREGERVIGVIERGGRPFSEPWPQWKPDPDWPIPELPDDWATLPAYS